MAMKTFTTAPAVATEKKKKEIQKETNYRTTCLTMAFVNERSSERKGKTVSGIYNEEKRSKASTAEDSGCTLNFDGFVNVHVV
jgi:hypothetical protein